MRDRLGELEDRFFATVFLGSGLLFIAMIFTAAAIAGGIIRVLQSGSATLVQSGAYTLGQAAEEASRIVANALPLSYRTMALFFILLKQTQNQGMSRASRNLWEATWGGNFLDGDLWIA
jgi:hypothetical protein